MAYAPILTLTLRHAYYGTTPPPLAPELQDARALAKQGLLAKVTGARLDLYGGGGAERPVRVSVAVRPRVPGIAALTPADPPGAVPRIALAPPAGAHAETLSAARMTGDVPARPRPPLAVLDIDLPASGAANLTVVFPTVVTIWAYNILGRPAAGLAIADSAGAVGFAHEGARALPDGRTAEVWAADRPLPLRVRHDFRLSLTRAGGFGPETLIAALPMPTRPTAPPAQPGATQRSDVYVTL